MRMPFGGSSVSISENFPSSYTAGQTYSIQLSVSKAGMSGTYGGFNVEVDKGTLPQEAVLLSKLMANPLRTLMLSIVLGHSIGQHHLLVVEWSMLTLQA